ncbi:MAG: SRPBCC family protein [Gammaproteobacteria bacterium]|nr:SRPBCC family protein [Gammaproteobacteria bacterium]MDD9896172.1 SRPBCC family protein [Gammaproteobacteria bacterium]MDD9958009.1 SRPBCC family protein [Gammaproteobacteria bacterium]
MEIVELQELLPHSVESVWEIISDVTRSDWVPAVDEISEVNGIRSFSMQGIGEIQEKILINDGENHRLQYSAIKTPNPLEHHLATIELADLDGKCQFKWTTEIAPERAAPTVEQGMKISLEGLKQVLSNVD